MLLTVRIMSQANALASNVGTVHESVKARSGGATRIISKMGSQLVSVQEKERNFYGTGW